MNYIAEVNSFYNWVLFNSIPADSHALWHLLMQMNNRCAVKINNEWYWKVEFTVPNKTIISMLTFSRQQLDRMRNILIQTGRIEYKKGKGSQAGTYKIIPFDSSLVEDYVDNFPEKVWTLVSHNVAQSVTQSVTQSGHNPLHKAETTDGLCNIIGTLTKNNNNINNIYNNSFCGDDDNARETQQTERSSDFLPELNEYYGITEAVKHEAVQFAQMLFGKYTTRQPSRHDIVQVFELVMRTSRDNDGAWRLRLDAQKKELLEYAFKQASDTGCRTWAYIRGVLEKLRQRGLKDADECEYYDAERYISKNHR